MAYDLIGCMEKNGDVYQPVWEDPCTGLDMPGCMVEVDGKLAPKLIGGFGFCPDDKVGCMEDGEDGLRPVLTYDEYDSAEELYEACCVFCGGCLLCAAWGECGSPQYIEVTFSDILWCPGDGAGYANPNDKFTLEYDADLSACWSCVPGIDSACAWTFFTDTPHLIHCDCVIYAVGATKYILLGLTYDSGVRGCTDCAASATYYVFYYAAVWTCIDTGPFTNARVVGNCNVIITQGYDGEAVINWSP